MALITMPGVQKPHCRAWCSRNIACIGCSVPSFAAMPSIVVTLDPFAWTASMVQLLTDSPFTCTTHAPHWLVSQPTCVPVRPMPSRSISTSRVLPSTSAVWLRPFTVSDTCGIVFLP